MMWASDHDALKSANTAGTAAAPLKASCSEAHIMACVTTAGVPAVSLAAQGFR